MQHTGPSRARTYNLSTMKCNQLNLSIFCGLDVARAAELQQWRFLVQILQIMKQIHLQAYWSMWWADTWRRDHTWPTYSSMVYVSCDFQLKPRILDWFRLLLWVSAHMHLNPSEGLCMKVGLYMSYLLVDGNMSWDFWPQPRILDWLHLLLWVSIHMHVKHQPCKWSA